MLTNGVAVATTTTTTSTATTLLQYYTGYCNYLIHYCITNISATNNTDIIIATTNATFTTLTIIVNTTTTTCAAIIAITSTVVVTALDITRNECQTLMTSNFIHLMHRLKINLYTCKTNYIF